jgi:hypothetical protein
MEEAGDRPPSMILIDNYFAVYRKRRRVLISGKAPLGLAGDRPLPARAWRAYQHRMQQEPPWERAERYQLREIQQVIQATHPSPRLDNTSGMFHTVGSYE